VSNSLKKAFLNWLAMAFSVLKDLVVKRKPILKKSLIALTSLGLVFSVNATTVIPMKGVSVLYINGQETESKIGSSEVEPGEAQLVVRMDKKVGRGSSQTVYTSAPYVVTLNVSGDELKINHPVARSKQEAEAAFRQDTPQWRITQDGNSVTYTQEKLKGGGSLLPYMNIDELIVAHNQERGISFTTAGATTSQSSATATAVTATTAAVATAPASTAELGSSEVKQPIAAADNVEQLKSWYQKASKAERKEFRKWMIDQE
jgi:uncharacterized protein YccT (UPF0319 family)